MNLRIPNFWFLLAGLGLGLVLVIAATAIILFTMPAQVAPAPTSTPSNSPTRGQTLPPEKVIVLQTATPSPLGKFQSVAEDAERYIASGEPEKVKPLVEPWLSRLDEPKQKAAAYRLLGQAEDSASRSRLAAVYYRQMVEYEWTVEDLLILAITYERGGEYSKAYAVYNNLLDMPVASEDYADIQDHLKWLVDTCHCKPEPY